MPQMLFPVELAQLKAVEKELAETKAVLSDLLQERMPRVYLLMRTFARANSEPRGVFLTRQLAAAAAEEVHSGLVWTEHVAFDPGGSDYWSGASSAAPFIAKYSIEAFVVGSAR